MIWLGLFAPLIGFLVLLLPLSRLVTSLIGCMTILISFLSFASFLPADMPQSMTLFQWINFRGLEASFSLHLDHLSLLMTLIITGVGFLIHVYSIGYTDHEKNFTRYFACMNFFVFSMLLLVLASNLILLFVGWEGVGLASYLLIGFYYQRPAASAAATKAFVVNRIGDLGLLLGILLTFYTFGTGEIAEITHRSEEVGALLLLLYLCGAIAKSAQLPLHIWLPDAMEGPTPVSALIHAATMVTAGVYLIVRLHPLFMEVPEVLHFIGYLGGITALFAAFCAVGQTDLKRVLAYSTVSQLGLMFLACGVGAFYAAMFHLTTHAFVKALLFLSAGNVVHMTGTTDMNQMGGLRKFLPKTHILFLIGVLAMSGIPPLAAFFSKDLILEEEYRSGFQTLFITGLVTSLLTAFYLTRAYCLTFLGEAKKSAKEAPYIMLIPVAVLALLAVGGGFLGFSFEQSPLLEHFLAEDDPTLETQNLGFHMGLASYLSIIGSVLGVVISAFLYKFMGEPLQLLKKAFFIDEIYDKLLVQPLKQLATDIASFLEPVVFDGALTATARGTAQVAKRMQQFQSGQIRSYVAWMALGAALLIFTIAWRTYA